jgi:MFS family permease
LSLPPAFKVLTAFRSAQYRRYWLSNAVSVTGTWMQSTAQQWYVLGLAPDFSTGTQWLAIVSACQFLPMLVLSLFVGALLDRVSRKWVLFASQILFLVSSLGLGLLMWQNLASFEVVVGFALLSGLANAFDIPARQSLVPQLVERSNLANAVALNSLLFNLGRVLGASAFGLLAPITGIASIYIINATSFLGFLWVILFIPNEQKTAKNQNIFKEIADGIGYVWKTPAVRGPILLLAALSITVINFNIITPVFSKNGLGLDETGFGFMGAAFGLGAMFSALSQWRIQHLDAAVRLNIGAWIIVVSMAVLAFMPNAVLGSLCLFVAGAGMITYTVNANSTVQLATPDALRGRVMSVYTLMFAGLNPVGALVVGQSMAILGPRWGIVLVAGLAALACVVLRPRAAQ